VKKLSRVRWIGADDIGAVEIGTRQRIMAVDLVAGINTNET